MRYPPFIFSNSLIDTRLNHINYEDPNINVAIPFFGISGNHDDATGVCTTQYFSFFLIFFFFFEN